MTITDFAIKKTKTLIKEQSKEGHGIRIAVLGGGCSGFTYDIDFEDKAREGDQVFEKIGLKIFVDPMSIHYLDGTIVDYVESFKYSGFRFDNPNASKTCGCGSSFSV